MFEIDQEFIELMNGVLYRHLKSKTTHNEMASYAFDYSKWPDCEPAKAMNLFLANLPRGYEYTKAVTADRYRDYIQHLHDRAIPKSVDLVGERIETHLKAHWQRKFVREVTAHPERLDALIQEYQSNKPSGVKLFSLNDELVPMMTRHMEKLKSGEAMVTIPAFPLLSDYIGGFNDSRVTLITAKTGFGKTNLAVSLALSASDVMEVLYFNMEMDMDSFSARFLHHGADIDNGDWRRGTFLGNKATEAKIYNFAETRKQKKDIHFTGGSALSMAEIATSVFSKFDGKTPGIIFVDYDQKIKLVGSKDEWKGLLEAVSELEEIAKRTKTHVVLLSQANDEGRSRASIRMEQGASNVLNFYKVPNGTDARLDRTFIKGLKTRYSSDKVIEVGVDLARSKVFEIGLVESDRGPFKSKHAF